MSGFGLIHSVCFNELSNCMFCLRCFVKWNWCMIWMWDQLDIVLIWLNLICANFHVLFWIISPSLTLGLVLGVCFSCLSCVFKTKSIWHGGINSLGLSCLFDWCWLTLSLFCRWLLSHLCWALAYALLDALLVYS